MPILLMGKLMHRVTKWGARIRTQVCLSAESEPLILTNTGRRTKNP